MTKICLYCRCENHDNFNFCYNCGKPLILEDEHDLAFDYKKLIIISYIIIIIFAWGGLILNRLFNGFGFIGFIGLFLPFYLIQSNNPVAKKHGYIQIIISLAGVFSSLVLLFNIF